MKGALIRWHDQEGVGRTLKEIEKTVRVNDDRVSFEGFEFSYHELILRELLDIVGIENHNVRNRLIWKVIVKCANAGKWGSSDFKGFLCRFVNEYQSESLKKFAFQTKVSLPIGIKPVLRRRESAFIKVGSFPSRAKSVHEEYMRREGPNFNLVNARHYCAVRWMCTARSVDEGFEEANREFTFLRGMWNLYLNQRIFLRSSNGRVKPINSIRPGSATTVHEMDHSLAQEALWYEPSTYGYLTENEGTFNDKERWRRALEFEKNFYVKWKRLPYANDVKDAVIDYCEALDRVDFDVIFLQLWSILERLSAPEARGNNDKVVQRCSLLFKDSDDMRVALNILKRQRNNFVHKSQEIQNAEEYVCLLKAFVERLIRFHVGTSYRFKSLEEACEFLSLPTDHHLLNREIKRLKYRIRYTS